MMRFVSGTWYAGRAVTHAVRLPGREARREGSSAGLAPIVASVGRAS